MKDNLPSCIRDPMCFSYFGDIKLAYIEFNEYNANESFRVRKVCSELTPDDKSLYFVTIYKERYNVSNIVKRDLPSIFYGKEANHE